MGHREALPLSIPHEQEATAALLERLAGCKPVETHISAVFIGADTVWKLRKAVTLSFLDFSTVAERRRTAEREFELNTPAAPGLYRDVVKVTRSADGVELGGTGEVVDWVVRMARVPSEDFLDRLAERGLLTPERLDQLGDTVAAYHARLPPQHIDHEAALRRVAEGNHQAALSAGLPRAESDAWLGLMRETIAAKAGWLADRVTQGFIRRGHGDLHLGNLCLWRGVPVPFDALEFDEALATIDLGYDLAFLLMDLEQHCGREAANRVLNRYVARTGDAGLVAGLPIFLSMRAMVRAHVEAQRGRDWQHYFACATAMLHAAPARVLALGGLPGTGKSTLARRIAPLLGPAPGALILRSDEARKRRYGVSPEQKLPAEAYDAAVGRAVMAGLGADLATASGGGHAVIADASFLDPADRAAIALAAGAVPFQGVWLEAPLAVLEARVVARHGDASDADLAVLHRAAQADAGQIDWMRLNSADSAAVARFVETVTESASPC